VGATVEKRQPRISAASFGGMGGADGLNPTNSEFDITFPA